MNEIVIERPRIGSRDKNLKRDKKALQTIYDDDYEGSRYEPLCRSKTKHLSDHLAPLRRLLRSKVGQYWDDIYSELCQRLDTNKMIGQHVLSHVWDYVEPNVLLVDGVPYRRCHQRYKQKQLGYWRDEFFVHPDTGILCLVEKAPKEKKSSNQRDDLIVIDSYHQYRKLNDIWYLITIQDLPSMSDVKDVVLKVSLNPAIAKCEYGREVYAISKRQCNKKEIKFIMQQLNKTSVHR